MYGWIALYEERGVGLGRLGGRVVRSGLGGIVIKRDVSVRWVLVIC